MTLREFSSNKLETYKLVVVKEDFHLYRLFTYFFKYVKKCVYRFKQSVSTNAIVSRYPFRNSRVDDSIRRYYARLARSFLHAESGRIGRRETMKSLLKVCGSTEWKGINIPLDAQQDAERSEGSFKVYPCFNLSGPR